MRYIRGIENYNCPSHTAITLGKFDGLHRGHQKLIEQVKKHADGQIKSVVFSFDMFPFFKELGKQNYILMTSEEKCLRLEEQVDYLVECPFVEKIHTMDAETFIKEVLMKKFHAKYVVVGTDFRFGYQKKGDIYLLEKYQQICGYKLIVIEKEMYGEREISSTFVKEEIHKGNMELAEKLLGYPYTILGTVEHGEKLGRKLGFPTMNVIPAEEKLLSPNGVYVSSVMIDGKEYRGISNVGCKPTVSDKKEKLVETFLFDYDEDAYGKKIQIRLYSFVREEKKFSSVSALQKQMRSDIEMGKGFFKK
ncbi:riboflavin biosynthesis protein RibF [Lachnospiraceae bacterium 2_1_46FAA]|nr:riboflavin biosynthesis protein RibF [Lachnospiraceae bacterium 2_1_46FAA]